MPGGDRTGPMGQGPMTGRAAGFCAGYRNPGYSNSRYGRGFGRFRGQGFGRGYWGRGRRFWYTEYDNMPYPQPNKEDEKAYLENLVKDLEDELKSVKEKIKNLSKEEKK